MSDVGGTLSASDYCIEADTAEDLEKALVLAAAESYARSTAAEESNVVSKCEKDCRSNSPADLSEENQSKHEIRVTNKRKQKSTVADDDEAPGVKLQKKQAERGEGYAKVVATHYNKLEEKGLDERSKSRIFYMRNFHNWLKSMLINEYLTKIKHEKKHNTPIRVHDMCCGKGGDLLKWRKGNINHLICSDIATVSLEQCKQRYADMKNRNQRDRNPSALYSAEYIAADCSRVRLREKFKDPSVKLDLVSCQFAFHYSFESLPQAEHMIRNAAECLQPGGYFIGTIPDAYELISRARKAGSNTFGNDLFRVILDFDADKSPPLFGAKYNFHLDGVVDCPEFLVYFPIFVKLAKKYGLKLVTKEKFSDFYDRMKYDGRNLLGNMKSLETYPPYDGTESVGNAADDYKHVDEFLMRDENGRNTRLGTLSKSEWEASSLYLIFAFEKVKSTLSATGDPVYDI